MIQYVSLHVYIAIALFRDVKPRRFGALQRRGKHPAMPRGHLGVSASPWFGNDGGVYHMGTERKNHLVHGPFMVS